ncbi:iron chelate uptake ABC transporter family permease subunit [Antribacter sp. KLBMP9083]|uniref:Iron chelate uptake ABC transporter family permease subunit n=1 Tax=Antribacter soli TaxID=2910976 RepID=A0AA41QI01_9MICO|nr:iron chelate uptake ABC transporter family permease subunit [Antribacter soli]MCF4123533.1 iron chelate uptake ABC transporter family permease subunit [Antribacter soli]
MTSTVDAPTAVGRLRVARRRRLVLVLATFLVLGVALATLALTLGAASLPPGRALLALLGAGDAKDVFIVHRLRLPRVEAALLVGAAFGLAGALFQSTLRNPLASPDILGIASGASLGAVWALLGLGLTGLTVSGFAFLGASAVAVAIWFLAWRRGLHSVRFVLVGVGLAYLCSSVLAWLLARADVREAQSALLWTVGSVSDVRGEELGLLAGGVAILALGVALVSRTQGPLALGDDNARALGVHVDAARVGSLLLAVALVALATSFAGPIAFVALVAPAIARRLVDDGGAALLPSAATGAVLVLVSDLAGQHALFGVGAPVGIVTGLVGAPYLLWLLATNDKRSAA